MREAFTVLRKEIKDTLRDRRTLYTAVIMPIVLMPLIMVGSIKLQESQVKSMANQEAIVAVADQSTVPSLVAFLNKQDKIKVSDIQSDFENKLIAGTIQTYVNVPGDFESKLLGNQPIAVQVYQKSTDQKSSVAASKVETALTAFNQMVVAQKMTKAGLDPSILQSVVVESKDLASDQEKGGYFLGMLLPMFIVLFSIAGGMYVAIDVSAGEKERKTLEALLLAPLSRFKLVTGKYLAVATTSVTSVLLSIASMYVAFKIWPPNFGSSMAFSMNLTTVLLMVVLGIILSIMFAGFLLAVAIFAKSFKEAQNYITPFYLLAILPVSIFSSIPGFKPTLGLFFIPSVNAVFLFKESLLGVTDWLHIAVTIGSTIVMSIIAITLATKLYSRESILFRD